MFKHAQALTRDPVKTAYPKFAHLCELRHKLGAKGWRPVIGRHNDRIFVVTFVRNDEMLTVFGLDCSHLVLAEREPLPSAE